MFQIKRSAIAAAAAVILMHGSVRAQAPAGGWQQASDGPGRFTVMVPGALTANPPQTDADGITTYTFAAREPARVYLIVYADGNPSNPRKEMDDARDTFLKGVGGTLVSQHDFKSAQPVGDAMATEFTARIPGRQADCKARLFFHKTRLYMIGVVTLPGAGSALDVDKFLDSFRITS
ncbi:MAG: hypothetical protein WD690_01325 [Vicinamibacterales bacterium]